MTKFLLSAALAAATVAIAPAIAQPVQPAPVPPPAPLIERAPHVAKIHTRAEVGNHVRAMFERLDGNRDGFITKAEAEAVKAMQGDRRAKRLQRRGAAGGERRMANRGAMFDRLDTNRDGSITRGEFDAHHAQRQHKMQAGGGQGAHAMRGMRMGMGMGLGGRMFDLADSNRDGRVSLPEATAAAYRHFDMADVNRDGQITREERIQIRQRMRAERRPG